MGALKFDCKQLGNFEADHNFFFANSLALASINTLKRKSTECISMQVVDLLFILQKDSSNLSIFALKKYHSPLIFTLIKAHMLNICLNPLSGSNKNSLFYFFKVLCVQLFLGISVVLSLKLKSWMEHLICKITIICKNK